MLHNIKITLPYLITLAAIAAISFFFNDAITWYVCGFCTGAYAILFLMIIIGKKAAEKTADVIDKKISISRRRFE
ncbi:hypothetical protein ACFOWM_03550 [Ferruginibacter yonginensis]|uniref:Uncharacterized protein n=1 Tax=Ferruginibacter yonginensis TaxID=1310416 RepID=A0ABV8QP84_9BACT